MSKIPTFSMDRKYTQLLVGSLRSLSTRVEELAQESVIELADGAIERIGDAIEELVGELAFKAAGMTTFDNDDLASCLDTCLKNNSIIPFGQTPETDLYDVPLSEYPEDPRVGMVMVGSVAQGFIVKEVERVLDIIQTGNAEVEKELRKLGNQEWKR